MIALAIALFYCFGNHAMFKSVAIKTAAASMAAGTALSYPKIKREVATWKIKQQLKKEIAEQNKVVISSR